MAKKQKEEKIIGALTVGELIEELRKLPTQAEIQYTDVCGNEEAEIYQVEIDAKRGIVLIVGDTVYDEE